MNNYEYIIASLPVLSPDYKFGTQTPADLLEEITGQCSDSDKEVIDFLEKGFVPDNLCEEFYTEALSHRNRFIREYFTFDLNVRNAKVRYLNAELGRPAAKDVLDIDGGEFEEAARLGSVLGSGDILSRERGIDELTWDKIDEITTFDYFDIEAILGFLSKLQIVSRWFLLDEQTGREMFRKLVSEVRGTFKGVEYSDK